MGRTDVEVDKHALWPLDIGASFHMIDQKHIARPKERIREVVWPRTVYTANGTTTLSHEIDTLVSSLNECITVRRTKKSG